MESNDMVLIKWVDAWGINPEWEDKSEALKKSYCLVDTVGFLLETNPIQTILIMSKDTNTGMVCGTKVIPTKCIQTIIELQKVYPDPSNNFEFKGKNN